MHTVHTCTHAPIQVRVKGRQVVCAHKPMPTCCQLAEEEASEGEFHQLPLVQGLAQHAAQELVVQGRVHVDEVCLQKHHCLGRGLGLGLHT